MAREHWRDFDSLKSLALVRTEAEPCDNHEPYRWNLLVRISPGSLAEYGDWHAGRSMPLGTLIVAEHRARHGTDQGPYYFAQKASGGWQFGAASADGWLLNATDSCGLCHAEATADHVFGLHPLAKSRPDTKRPDGG